MVLVAAEGQASLESDVEGVECCLPADDPTPASVSVEVTIQVAGELSSTDFRNGVIEAISESGHDVDVTID